MRSRLYWFANDTTPADGEHKTEAEAREYAARRSAMVQGRVELLSPQGKVVATYVGGELVG